MPMWQSEAMWMQFGNRSRLGDGYPFAVKIATGKVNAITGSEWDQHLVSNPQDYIVLPSQPWLDGYCVSKGEIRQFVAAPLGDGQTVEEQLTGRADQGGVQITVYPMKSKVYETHVLQPEADAFYDISDLRMNCMAAEMGLAAGGLMRQEIYKDEYGIDAWDTTASARVFVTILNAQQWHAITRDAPATRPISNAEYARAGIPWFDWYDADKNALGGAKVLRDIKPVVSEQDPTGTGIPLTKPVQLGPTQRKVREPSPTLDLTSELGKALTHITKLEKEIRDLRTSLQSLLNDAEDAEAAMGGVDTKPPMRGVKGGHTKGPPTRLVIIIDGKEFSGNVAADVLAEAVSEFGLGRIAGTGIKLSGYPLVSRTPPPEGRGCRQIDGWYVMTHASNADKKATLEQLARDLGEEVTVMVLHQEEL